MSEPWTYRPYVPGSCEHIPALPLDDWSRCLRPRAPGQAYCLQHLGSGRQAGSRLGRRNKDQQRALRKWTLESLLNDIAQELDSGI
jgi:hypothetical protein